jgi:hypothetical protein
MSTAELATLIPIGAAALVAIITAWRSNSQSKATDAKLTAHISAVTPPEATFQERTGTAE